MGSVGSNSSIRTTTAQTATQEAYRPLLSKTRLDEYINDFTPETFLGGTLTNGWSLNSLSDTGLVNSPDTIDIGGYTFRRMGAPTALYDPSDKKLQTAIMNFDYQSDEQVGNEYPVLSIAIRVKSTPKRGTKTEIIKDGYYRTKFW